MLYAAEGHGTPAMHAAGIHGVNMEGKEQRFGAAGTALYATVTTDGASGAVNGAMESLSGLGGLVPLANMVTGEVVFGGIGTGLSSMLLVVLMGVFLAGLMVGRTPQFLGKKIEGREMKLVLIGTIAPLMVVLLLAAVASVSEYGTVSIYDSGPQGFSETVYAYASQAMNNGSAFAGYTGFVQPPTPRRSASPSPTSMGGVAMLLGRYIPILAALAVAGGLRAQARLAVRRGHAAHGRAELRRHAPRRHPDRRAAELRARDAAAAACRHCRRGVSGPRAGSARGRAPRAGGPHRAAVERRAAPGHELLDERHSAGGLRPVAQRRRQRPEVVGQALDDADVEHRPQGRRGEAPCGRGGLGEHALEARRQRGARAVGEQPRALALDRRQRQSLAAVGDHLARAQRARTRTVDARARRARP